MVSSACYVYFTNVTAASSVSAESFSFITFSFSTFSSSLISYSAILSASFSSSSSISLEIDPATPPNIYFLAFLASFSTEGPSGTLFILLRALLAKESTVSVSYIGYKPETDYIFILFIFFKAALAKS
jgi:hypothetical protein